MNLKILPKKLCGVYMPPPSKSLTHRAIICASLSNGISVINNIDYSDDILYTINAMRVLGAKIDEFEDKLLIRGIELKSRKDDNEYFRKIDCGESGSTIRFLMPLATFFNGDTEFIAKGNLINRPMDVYFDIFDNEGIKYKKTDKSIIISSNSKLKLKKYSIRGDISSQFISGLLFCLPMLDFDTEIEVKGDLQSKSYIDLTIETMKKFGVNIDIFDYKIIKIKGKQRYKSCEFTVESDFSQAAFFIVANALGSNIEILGLDELGKKSIQGDRQIIEIINDFLKLNSKHNVDETFYLDGSQIPDIIPVLALLFSHYNIKTKITNLNRLKIKESDRLESTVEELKKLGADIESGYEFHNYFMEINHKNDCSDENINIISKDSCGDNNILINKHEFVNNKYKFVDGVNNNYKLGNNIVVSSHKDHRIAMMLAIAATICNVPIILNDAECVSKSYPSFWRDYKALGGEIYDCDLGKEI